MGRGMRVLFSQALLASPENGKPYACIISQAEISRLLKIRTKCPKVEILFEIAEQLFWVSGNSKNYDSTSF
jgi:hypothetical protein